MPSILAQREINTLTKKVSALEAVNLDLKKRVTILEADRTREEYQESNRWLHPPQERE